MPSLREGNIGRADSGINPAGIWAYFDKIQVWLKTPLTESERAFLAENCGGHLDIRQQGEVVRSGSRFWRVRFPDASYRQRIQLNQPSTGTLEFLAEREGVHLNFVEWALDWTFNGEDEKAGAEEFLRRHHVKKWHGHQGIRFAAGGRTRYTGPRGAANVFVDYSDRASKVTGEIFTVHCDWRISGVAALRRAGLASVRALIRANEREFWSDRMLLRDLDRIRLGRLYLNWCYGTRRRGRFILEQASGFAFDMDRRFGSTILWSLGSVQAVIDAYRDKFDVSRALIELDALHLLPRADTYFMIYADTSPRRRTTHSFAKTKARSRYSDMVDIGAAA